MPTQEQIDLETHQARPARPGEWSDWVRELELRLNALRLKQQVLRTRSGRTKFVDQYEIDRAPFVRGSFH